MSPRGTGESAITDHAVEAKTGKPWGDWMRLLDRWGAARQSHREIARHLRDHHGLDPWWSQTVTVRYERERGRRVVGERADGSFEVGVQRTIGAPRAVAFEALTDARQLGTWFSRRARVDLRVGGAYSNADGDRGTFVAIDRPRLLRFTWDNPGHCPGTLVEVALEAPARDRVVVRLRHRKLRSAAQRDEMREGWSWALDSLRSYLETGRPITHESWVEARRQRRGQPAR